MVTAPAAGLGLLLPGGAAARLQQGGQLAGFIQSDNPITNQWVLPTEGLVTACLLRGRGVGDEAYEFGVANMIRAIDSHGADGEFQEGLGYANMTVESMLYTAHAMASAGDPRALERPFLKRFGTWAVHHLLPGRMPDACLSRTDHHTARQSL